ncbi:EXTERNAL ALTERNATIVE NAD(P)H-UBIQUINONE OXIDOREDUCTASE B1 MITOCHONDRIAL [Salix koriyanagi]|uniref:EXTERNAL ALTERNATIVE NAD(P)H-UBIQUINONE OXIDOREDUCTASE B1 MITOCHONDRIAL n=1 Tax=Salix koriyanagi TaxID=2511006 RepID=A0A9Q0W0K0_9ROSI|nr:EXTERNAL ALTERNATIVE NAD(P)H-UBIQUINONE OXIDOREDUCTASE B1 MITOCHONDRIAL [Salix koriyanagi]
MLIHNQKQLCLLSLIRMSLRRREWWFWEQGWAGTSFLKDLDVSSYDVQLVSPRNYFAFTPLLPSVTCGTVEARSISEPVRNIIKKRNGEIQFYEAECVKIDAANNKVFCKSHFENNMIGSEDFSLEYDYLVVALGAQVNTFNTPGVMENCHFLKELEDAQKLRRSVIDCFEKASIPGLTEEERRTNLHFVVVGGGPTGVEFAAELHDFIQEDLVNIYPVVKDLVKITLIQSGDHILNMFDERISTFAEQKFQRDCIDVQTGCRVVCVSDKEITMKVKSKGEVTSIPHGLVVWSTGISTRPVVKDFMEQIGQANRRVLATNEWLRVKGCENVYALGDCATIDQRKIMDDIASIFKAADKDNSGTLTVQEFQDVVDDILVRYPQLEIYLKNKHLRDVKDLLKDPEGKDIKEVDIEGFKLALSQVDSQAKSLPATAQVAAQQGAYLSRCFNRREHCKDNPEGPQRFVGAGRHSFRSISVQASWAVCSFGRRAGCCRTAWRLGFHWSQHTVAVVFCLCQQTSELANKGAVGIGLDSEIHFRKRFESYLRQQMASPINYLIPHCFSHNSLAAFPPTVHEYI